MAYTARKVELDVLYALVKALNARQEALVTNHFHADITQLTSGHYSDPSVTNDTIGAANATDLGTSLTLVNQMRRVMDRHFADPIAHATTTSAQITIAEATNLTSAVTLGNDLKAKYNAHTSAANVHFNTDSSNTVTNANATDQATLNTVLNEMKGDFNAHVTGAPVTVSTMVRVVPA